MDAIIALKLARGLDTLPSRRDLDKDALLLHTDRVVQCDELLGLGLSGLLVKGKTGVDLGRDTAGDDLQDFRAELDELHAPDEVSVSTGYLISGR